MIEKLFSLLLSTITRIFTQLALMKLPLSENTLEVKLNYHWMPTNSNSNATGYLFENIVTSSKTYIQTKINRDFRLGFDQSISSSFSRFIRN